MAVRSDITRDAEWFRYESIPLIIEVTDENGDPVDLSAAVLEWFVLREQGSNKIYLHKESGDGIDVDEDDTNKVIISVEETDYDDLPHGIHYHELWNQTTHKLLNYGDAYLNKTRGHTINA